MLHAVACAVLSAVAFKHENKASAQESGLYSIARNRGRPRLADAGAQETPVLVHTHPAAGKKVRNRRDRLPAAVCAGTDCQDEIPQRKPAARL
jgi:hypothetical protein